MKYGAIEGLNKKISRLVVGARGFKDIEECFEYYDAFYDVGYTVWDTGHSYYNGNTDRLIGKWMESRNNRDKVAVLAKVCFPSRDREKVTPFDITSELFDSLACLRTDYVDILMLHRDDPKVEIGPIVETLHKHWEEGRIKAYGASNWTHQRMGEANDYAKKRGLHPFTVTGPQLSLLEKKETDIHWWHDCASIGGEAGQNAREWYKNAGVSVFGYSALAVGFLGGKITPDNIESLIQEEKLTIMDIDAWYSDRNMGYLARAMKMAKIKGLTVPQVALRYITSLGTNDILDAYAVVATSKIKHIVENAAATEEDFSAEELAWLEMRTNELNY